MPVRLFVTGFGPFGATKDNPSAVLAAACGVPFRVLDVSWAAVDAWLDSGEGDGYEVLLHLGFADRSHLTPELFARNSYGEAPDVQGVVRSGPIETDGPAVVGSRLWTAPLLAGLIDGAPIRISEDAGRYLCNYIAYRSTRRFPAKRVGFLHVPSFETVAEAEQVAIVQRLISAM